MIRFSQLVYDLELAEKTNDKVDLLVGFLRQTDDEDILWALYLFTGRRPKRVTNAVHMKEWAAEYAGIPTWLFEECFKIAGDLSETIALVLPPPELQNNHPVGYWIRFLKDLEKRSEDEKKAAIYDAWGRLTPKERFVFNKLSSSTLKIDITQNMLIRALSLHTQIPGNVIAHRLSAQWDETQTTYQELLLEQTNKDDLSRPLPLKQAQSLEREPALLGVPEEWSAEWKWDGLRCQIIMRGGHIFIWTKGEELVTDKFPELASLSSVLPDGCVLDGEILPQQDGMPLPFGVLQNRLNRKTLNAKILKESPVMFYAYDLLEWEGADIRNKPLAERQILLEVLIDAANYKPYLYLSPGISFGSWEELAILRDQAREQMAEGLVLKRITSHYNTDPQTDDWWTWKTDPFSIDAVMIYAQRGTGRHSNHYTDFTFAVWREKELVAFTKANTGLTDHELTMIDSWVKANTVERFGPVRTVKPELVFELGFEGIQRSARHKSGVVLRLPRILRWRQDKTIKEADTLGRLIGLLEAVEKRGG